MYLLIALGHAIPVFLIAVVTRSRLATGITAAVMIAIGVATGSPAYTAIDVIAVAIATWLSWQVLPSRNPSSRVPGTQIGKWLGGVAKDTASAILAIGAVLAVLGLAIIGYNRYLGECADDKLAQLNMTYEQCYATYIKKR